MLKQYRTLQSYTAHRTQYKKRTASDNPPTLIKHRLQNKPLCYVLGKRGGDYVSLTTVVVALFIYCSPSGSVPAPTCDSSSMVSFYMVMLLEMCVRMLSTRLPPMTI